MHTSPSPQRFLSLRAPARGTQATNLTTFREIPKHVSSSHSFNDKAVNGTSLMLLLKIAGQCLLFPGDAQWGTWQAALENPKSRQLLAKTTFYKVGHHNSHNATPVEFVEHTVGDDFLAMVSTHHVDQWASIPREQLLAAMAKKSQKIARSDKEAEAPSPTFRVVPDRYIETEIPLAL